MAVRTEALERMVRIWGCKEADWTRGWQGPDKIITATRLWQSTIYAVWVGYSTCMILATMLLTQHLHSSNIVRHKQYVAIVVLIDIVIG